jgi:hypothetical protein
VGIVAGKGAGHVNFAAVRHGLEVVHFQGHGRGTRPGVGLGVVHVHRLFFAASEQVKLVAHPHEGIFAARRRFMLRAQRFPRRRHRPSRKATQRQQQEQPGGNDS